MEESFFFWSRSKFVQVMISMVIMVELKLAVRRVGMTKEKVDLLHRSRFMKTHVNTIH